MNEIEQQIVDGVERNGWFTVDYVPGPGDPEIWFTYTIGLTKSLGWPEMICFGLDEQRRLGVLRDTIAECWEQQVRPQDGLELDRVLQGATVRLKRLDDLSGPYFAMADWYAQHSGTATVPERLQVMWPDRDGRFPDDPDCDPDVRDRQTPKTA